MTKNYTEEKKNLIKFLHEPINHRYDIILIGDELNDHRKKQFYNYL